MWNIAKTVFFFIYIFTKTKFLLDVGSEKGILHIKEKTLFENSLYTKWQ